MDGKDYLPNMHSLKDWKWRENVEEATCRTALNPALEARLEQLNIKYEIEWSESMVGEEIRHRVEAVNRWYQHDWGMIDNKIRSSIVEGISVFLSIFDLPDVARVFCPPKPRSQPQLRQSKTTPTTPTSSSRLDLG